MATNWDDCFAERLCNWGPSDSYPISSLECTEAQNTTHFCGVRFSENLAVYREVFVSELECGREFCVTPFKNIILDPISKDSCDANGFCTGLCLSSSPQCVPTDPYTPSACYTLSLTPLECVSKSGVWLTSFDVCTFPLLNAQAECAAFNFTYFSCELESVNECRDSPYDLVKCIVNDWVPCPRDMCDDTVGLCTDTLVLPVAGACVMPFTANGDQLYCYADTVPTQIG